MSYEFTARNFIFYMKLKLILKGIVKHKGISNNGDKLNNTYDQEHASIFLKTVQKSKN